MPMFFLSGAFFPLGKVPLWMAWLSRLDPVTYGVDALRQEALSRSVPRTVLGMLTLYPVTTDITVMGVLAVAFIVPAVWQFGRRD
jgi:ABC-2 type transport system permease protein